MRPALLIESNAALRAAIQLRHRHLMVDEYQDVNRASVRLVKALAGDAKRLWVVGDARQAIYRFRGASSVNMAGFATEFPNAVIEQLETSYRSTQPIINTITAFADQMSSSIGMLPLKLKAERGDCPAVPDLRRFSRDDDEAEGVAAAVRGLEGQGVRLRDQAVLCRTNRRLNEIASALESRGIPVLHLGSLFERDEVRDLLALISLAVDPFGDPLVRVAALPRYDVPLQDVHLAIRHLRDGKGPTLERLADLSHVANLSTAAVSGLTLLARDLQGLSPRAHAWDLVTSYLLDRTDVGLQMAAAATVPAPDAKCRCLAIAQFPARRKPGSFRATDPAHADRVRQLVLLAEERDLRQVPTPALHAHGRRATDDGPWQ